MGSFLSRVDEDDEPAEGPEALGAADDKTEPLAFEDEEGLTKIKDALTAGGPSPDPAAEPPAQLGGDGRTYAEVVRGGPEKSDWKFVPTGLP